MDNPYEKFRFQLVVYKTSKGLGQHIFKTVGEYINWLFQKPSKNKILFWVKDGEIMVNPGV